MKSWSIQKLKTKSWKTKYKLKVKKGGLLRQEISLKTNQKWSIFEGWYYLAFLSILTIFGLLIFGSSVFFLFGLPIEISIKIYPDFQKFRSRYFLTYVKFFCNFFCSDSVHCTVYSLWTIFWAGFENLYLPKIGRNGTRYYIF